LALWAGPALAHAGHEGVADVGWTFEPWVLCLLALSSGLYILGGARLWSRSLRGRRTRIRQAAAFAGGWLLLVIALVSPLHNLSEGLFTAHMLEHEILMVAAAPVLVLARPIGCFLWALPPPWRTAGARAAHLGAVRSAWRLLTRPLVATVVHGVAVWLWHVPALFSAALRHEGIHWAQHLSFFLTALLFWWAVLRASRRNHAPGVAVFALFATVLHSGFLGVLITFAREPVFPGQTLAAHCGLTALEDQQLAGLIMWIPGGMAYVLAALAAAGAWIRASGMEAYRGAENRVAVH
jgi:cytochrome c oxidase assembly factor CtaG